MVRSSTTVHASSLLFSSTHVYDRIFEANNLSYNVVDYTAYDVGCTVFNVNKIAKWNKKNNKNNKNNVAHNQLEAYGKYY